MDILVQLGVNQSLGYQLVLFLVLFVVLKYLLFGPYYEAFKKREERTLGQTEMAEQFVAETKAMEEVFAQRAREANDRYREVFDKIRVEAAKEQDQIINGARVRAKERTETIRKDIQKEIEVARKDLMQEVPSVTQLINQKLIGKEISA